MFLEVFKVLNTHYIVDYMTLEGLQTKFERIFYHFDPLHSQLRVCLDDFYRISTMHFSHAFRMLSLPHCTSLTALLL